MDRGRETDTRIGLGRDTITGVSRCNETSIGGESEGKATLFCGKMSGLGQALKRLEEELANFGARACGERSLWGIERMQMRVGGQRSVNVGEIGSRDENE